MTNLERGEGGRGRVSGECGRKLAQRRFFAPTSQLRGLDDTISVFSVTCNSTWARLVVAGLVAGLHAGDLGSPARILTRDPICTYRLLSWIAGSNVGKDGLPPRLVHVATWGVHSRTACAPAAITRAIAAAILCTAGSRQFLCLYRAAPLIRQRLSRCCSWRPPL